MSLTSPSTTRPPLLILYGSQTGCAEEVAERLSREASRLRFSSVRCCTMDQYDKKLLPSAPLVLFVCSTTGQGEAPDNMKNFYRFLLRRDLPSTSLSSLSFGVFGLGDSSYPLFNAIARRLHQRLLDLSGSALVDRGLGDDQSSSRGVEEELERWSDKLWKKIEEKWPLQDEVSNASASAASSAANYRSIHYEFNEATRKYDVELLPASQFASKYPEDFKAAMSSRSSRRHPLHTPPVDFAPFHSHTQRPYTPLSLRLLQNRRLTPGKHFQDVRHIELELPSQASIQAQALAAAQANNNNKDTEMQDANDSSAIFIRSLSTPTPSSSSSSASSSQSPLPSFIRSPTTSSPSPSLASWHYSPGDVLLVHPCNSLPASLVSFLEAKYRLDFEQDWVRISLTPHAAQSGLQSDYPPFCSVRDLFCWHMDLQGTPRNRFFLQQLSAFAAKGGENGGAHEAEQEKLIELCSAEKEADWRAYCKKEKRTYGEILLDFPHSTPPSLSHLLQLVPRLHPRQFSIASAQSMHPDRIQLIVAVLDFVTPWKRKRSGVCSEFLAKLQMNTKVNEQGGEGEEQFIPTLVPCWLVNLSSPPSSFHPPPLPLPPLLSTCSASSRRSLACSASIVCVGPGTGIAPIRAIVQQRYAARAQRVASAAEEEKEDDTPKIMVFFGNRNREADFFYKEEWEQYARENVAQVEAVFSRDYKNNNNQANVDMNAAAAASSSSPIPLSPPSDRYVQHSLLRRGLCVARLLLRGATLMVSGSSSSGMPRDVRQAIVQIMQQHAAQVLEEEQEKEEKKDAQTHTAATTEQNKQWTEQQATEFVKEMEKKRKYLVEAY